MTLSTTFPVPVTMIQHAHAHSHSHSHSQSSSQNGSPRRLQDAAPVRHTSNNSQPPVPAPVHGQVRCTQHAELRADEQVPEQQQQTLPRVHEHTPSLAPTVLKEGGVGNPLEAETVTHAITVGIRTPLPVRPEGGAAQDQERDDKITDTAEEGTHENQDDNASLRSASGGLTADASGKVSANVRSSADVSTAKEAKTEGFLRGEPVTASVDKADKDDKDDDRVNANIDIPASTIAVRSGSRTGIDAAHPHTEGRAVQHAAREGAAECGPPPASRVGQPASASAGAASVVDATEMQANVCVGGGGVDGDARTRRKGVSEAGGVLRQTDAGSGASPPDRVSALDSNPWSFPDSSRAPQLSPSPSPGEQHPQHPQQTQPRRWQQGGARGEGTERGERGQRGEHGEGAKAVVEDDFTSLMLSRLQKMVEGARSLGTRMFRIIVLCVCDRNIAQFMWRHVCMRTGGSIEEKKC